MNSENKSIFSMTAPPAVFTLMDEHEAEPYLILRADGTVWMSERLRPADVALRLLRSLEITYPQWIRQLVDHHLLTHLRTQLSELYDSSAEIDAWLDSPNRMLGDRRPRDLITTREGYTEVCDKLQQVLDGAYT